jgi:hypothetical protein
METEVVGNKAGKDSRMEREHFVEGLALADRLKNELKCEIKMVDGRGIDEPLIIYRGKKIAQIAPRKGHLFTCYRFWSKDKIVKVHNLDETEQLFDSFKEYCKELDAKPKISKKVSGRRVSSSSEVIAKLEETIKGVSQDTIAIHLKPRTVTPELKKWAKTKGYSIHGDRLLFNRV